MNTKRAEMLMLLVTFCWGSSYLFMKEGLASIGPFTLVAYRFLLHLPLPLFFWGRPGGLLAGIC